MSTARTPFSKGESGFIFVLVTAGVFLFTTLAALAIGLGVISSARLASQNAANSAALAAIDVWVNSSSLSLSQRADRAKQRAEEILNRSHLPVAFRRSSGSVFGDLKFSWEASNSDTGGIIRLGRFYPIDPDPNTAGPCQGDIYPCFVYYDNVVSAGSAAVVNAAQIILNTPSNNPLIAPFATVFGADTFRVTVEATGTLVQRCTAFLVDLSGSSFSITHDYAPSTLYRRIKTGMPTTNKFPQIYMFDPDPANIANFAYSGFAFNSDFTNQDGDQKPLASIDCSSVRGTNGVMANDWGTVVWCNQRPRRWDDDGVSPPPGRPWDGLVNFMPTGPNVGYCTNAPVAPAHPPSSGMSKTDQDRYRRFHYRDDYVAMPSKFYGNETFLVDSYTDEYYKGPEPFTSYMRGFNAALRTLQLQQTALDKVTLKGFVGQPLNEVPPFLENNGSTSNLTSDLGYLIQITNLQNRGTFTRDAAGTPLTVSTKLSPNFIDHGFFAVVSTDETAQNTNLVEILDRTIQHLTAECPANAKKQIILATDGVASCSFQTHTDATTHVSNAAASTYRSCNYDFNTYLTSEQQLIGEDGYAIPAPSSLSGRPNAGGNQYPSILERLIQEQIALTVLLAGEGIEPNFRNWRDASSLSETYIGNAGAFLPYSKAVAFGMSALNTDNRLNYVNAHSSCPLGTLPEVCDENAYLSIGKTGYTFRRPNGTLARMAMRSGGLWCPLMPLAESSCYDASGQITEACRSDDTQASSLLNIDSATMAAQCTAQAVGYNPFLLAEPFTVCANSGNVASPGC